MTRKDKFNIAINYFQKKLPEAKTELIYNTPYQLIVAVILSAQCTDKRVNLITPIFFQKFPNFDSLANASYEEVYELIKSCSYPNNKTRHLVNMAKTIVNEYKNIITENNM